MPQNISRIDAHQHFWLYEPSEYSWISPEMLVLQQDFLPNKLNPLLKQHNFDGSIVVQARQTETETQFLIKLAQNHPEILAVIGWINLCSDNLQENLDKWQDYAKLKGYRHLVQDEYHPAEFLASHAFNRGVKQVLKQNKIYEILIHSHHLVDAARFCAKHDSTPLVLDHLGKPNIKQTSAKEWSKSLKLLSDQPHVFCKLSGLITEAGQGWSKEQLIPYIDVALECFGTERLMFGSDWPVCLLAGQYSDVYQLIEQSLKTLSVAEQNAIWGKNAIKVYRLDEHKSNGRI